MYPDNSETTIRLATREDIPMLVNLLPDGPQRIGFGKTTISKDKYIEYITRCIILDDHETYLMFKNNELISMLACYNSNIAPWWCALNFKMFKEIGPFDGFESGWITMGDHIAKIKEAEGRFSFFYVKAVRKMSRFMEKKFNQEYVNKFSEDGIGNRYIRTVEEFIPAGQKSKHDLFQKILIRSHTFVDDVAIIKWTCLQQYRSGFPEHLQEQTLQFNKHLGI
jgi:hypothetical protein